MKDLTIKETLFEYTFQYTFLNKTIYVMRYAIWYHLYNLKNVKNTHKGVLILVKLQSEAYNFTKINTPSWVFFTYFKLYKWYHIAQRTTYLSIVQSLALSSSQIHYKMLRNNII